MKINKIEFEAIGPFPGKHTIDFDLLGDSALFLIDGPTGAGKSTIIDAITYAVYGQMAGSTSDESRMRSTHAKPDTASWVRLTFTGKSGTYRVMRSPSYLRPKARGEGSTEEKASILVEEQMPDGNWYPLKFQWKEAGIKLAEIVGLTRDQFAQTVVLPQGEFADFLKADTKLRQPLLEKIFNTELYRRVSEKLKLNAADAVKAVAAVTVKVAALINSTQGALSLESEETQQLLALASTSETDAQLQLAMKDIAFEVKDRYKVSMVAFDKATEKNTSLTKALEARKLERAREDAVATTAKTLEEATEARDELIEELTEDNFTFELEELGFDSSLTDADWTKAVEDISRFAGSLKTDIEIENALPGYKNDQKDKQTKSLELSDENKALDKAIKKELPAQISLAEKEVTAHRDLASKLEVLEAKGKNLKGELNAHRELAESEATLLSLGAASKEARAKAIRDAENTTQLTKERFHNMGAELAEQLVEGEPCQVCGSTKHPNPAKASPDAVSAEDVDAAASKAKASAKAAEKANSDFDIATGKHGELAAKANRLLVAVEKDIEENNTAIELAEAATEKHAVALRNLEVMNNLISMKRDEQTKVLEQIATLKTELETLRTTIEKSESKLETLRVARYESVVERFEVLESLQEKIRQVNELDGKVQIAKAAAKTAKSDLDELVKHGDFAKVAEAEAALLAFNDVYLQAVSEKQAIETKKKAIENSIEQLAELVEKRSNLEASNKALIKLANVAQGKDSKLEQKLEAFVLQTMFEEVVAAANSRFSTILEGRYELRIPDEGGRKGNKGLDLAVFDRTTETERKPSTLSGGEQFCAALSLALGLSDIVLSNNSGLSIDTFFIDEGFGSLDSDRLSQVMQMLDKLKAGGRTIGLISHVDEMKAAITEHVDVKPIIERGPSSLTVSWMG